MSVSPVSVEEVQLLHKWGEWRGVNALIQIQFAEEKKRRGANALINPDTICCCTLFRRCNNKFDWRMRAYIVY